MDNKKIKRNPRSFTRYKKLPTFQILLFLMLVRITERDKIKKENSIKIV
jgi:hypothetical protein